MRGLKLPLHAYDGIRGSRTLTSAWIETEPQPVKQADNQVALSRVRGLKLFYLGSQ